MSYQSAIIDRALLVRWGRTMELADIQALGADLDRAAKELGGPVLYFGIVSEEAEAPPQAVRRALVETFTSRPSTWSVIRMVFEGQGVRHGLKRAVMAGLILMVKGKFDISAAESLEAALASVAPRLKLPPAEVLRLARERGLLRSH